MILYIIVHVSTYLLNKTRVINVWLFWTYSVTDTACRTPYNSCMTRILCAQELWLLVYVTVFVYNIILTFCCYCFSLSWYRNIEEAVKFTGLPQHRQLPYATKQLIAREVTVLPLLTHLRIKIVREILIMTGMVWPVSSDKWKVPLLLV